MTPRSWENWVEHYEGQGYRVLAPAYPGFEVEVEALSEDPSPIEALTVPAIVEHLEGIIDELDSPPIIMGHSAGGLLTQILLDHGYGAAGVAIDSVPAEGVRVVPVSQIRSLFPFLKNPANRHKAVGFTTEQFHYAFTNTLSREESDEVYERYHIPASGQVGVGGALANFTPGHQETYVDFRNEDRAPLLFIAGGEDNIMPPSVNQSNAKHYRHAKAPPTTRSSRAAPTTRLGRRAGRRSPTTPSSGPRRTQEHALQPEHSPFDAGVATEGGDSYEQRVTPLELFFDLVFVFALTQVTGFLADHLTWVGMLQGAALLAVLWSSWAVYSWLTNAVPAEDVIPARIVIFCAMAAMFVASLAVPGAFGQYGVLFGFAYFVVQLLQVLLYALAAGVTPEHAEPSSGSPLALWAPLC